MSPVISVLMAVRNGDKYLIEAVESIQKQRYSDIEFIIINDGSTDQTKEILRSKAQEDRRISVLSNTNPLGLATSLNRGLLKCQGEFVARIDADDLAHVARLDKQIEMFRKNDQLVLLGSNAVYVDANGAEYGWSKLVESDWSIRCLFPLINPLIHSSTMFRMSTVRNNNIMYDENYETAQDYELWGRLIAHGLCANLSQRLIKLRLHSESLSHLKKELRMQNGIEVQQNYLKELFGGGDQGEAAKQRHRTRFAKQEIEIKDRPLATLNGCLYGFELLSDLERLYPNDQFRESYQFLVAHSVKAMLTKSWNSESHQLIKQIIGTHKVHALSSLFKYTLKGNRRIQN